MLIKIVWNKLNKTHIKENTFIIFQVIFSGMGAEPHIHTYKTAYQSDLLLNVEECNEPPPAWRQLWW